ncbi:polysaccharide biosynthesis/export family protein [Pseudomonas sp. PD9R]|uniref:polysaccharide biosynthesis/export family protein n=1 Tax=Pseudomonas sp. PD9R TaxID=2853534 RepID=UPI001C4515C8|nr:polysaccharide biosynthesis/export family protein [Pseudomonas sp. PD9R]MBV6821823.1 polysaccharide biosynthesis/export family protein [Pseudomonas sp. PD9R]
MLRLLLPALCALSVCSGMVCADEKSGAYLLNPGDVIHYSVWGETKLEGDLSVLPDGSVNFPLARQIHVAGLDTAAVEKAFAAKLEKYIPDPDVSVGVKDPKGYLIYLNGKVLKPGPVQMTGPTSVLQALSMSGGVDKFADTGDIKIIRRKGTTDVSMPVRYKDLMSGKDMSTNYVLQVGDTLVVP